MSSEESIVDASVNFHYSCSLNIYTEMIRVSTPSYCLCIQVGFLQLDELLCLRYDLCLSILPFSFDLLRFAAAC